MTSYQCKIILCISSLFSVLFCVDGMATNNGYGVLNSQDDREECKHCEMITESFMKGMKRTEHMSYDGGDAAWAKEKLSPYTASEIRLMEIIEHICDEFGDKKGRCQMTVERWEHRFEDWWKNYQKHYPSLRYYLCVMKLKFCKPLECNKGWEEAKDEKVCADIDECKVKISPCLKNQFCVNTPGSFTCVPCHETCKGCYGEGPSMCKEYAEKEESVPTTSPKVINDTKNPPISKETNKPADKKEPKVEKKPTNNKIKSEQRKKEIRNGDPISDFIQSFTFYYLPHIIVGLTTSFFFIRNPLLALLWIICVILYRFKDHLAELSS